MRFLCPRLRKISLVPAALYAASVLMFSHGIAEGIREGMPAMAKRLLANGKFMMKEIFECPGGAAKSVLSYMSVWRVGDGLWSGRLLRR